MSSNRGLSGILVALLFAVTALALLVPGAERGLGSGERNASPAYPELDGLRDVQSIDISLQGGSVHAVLAGRFDGSDQVVAVYAVSSDQGRTWSKPVALSRPSDRPVISKRGNDVRLVVSGDRRVAVWQEQGEYPGGGPLVAAYSADGGKHWARGDSPAHEDAVGNQSHPDLAVDATGQLHLVWLDDREEKGSTQGLRYAQSGDQGAHWQGHATIDAEVCPCCWSRLITLTGQTVAVLYRDDKPRDMLLARWEPERRVWEGLGAVGSFGWQFAGCPHCGGGLAVARRGGREILHSLVWTGKDGVAGLHYLASTDLGQSWSAPLVVNAGLNRESDIGANDATVAIVYAARGMNGDSAVRLRRSRDGGATWAEPVTLTKPGVRADHPRVVATAQGLLAFWTEARTTGGKIWAMSAID